MLYFLGADILKILCIVQARMGSERLPGKVMKDLLGKPMIEFTLQRLKKSRYIDEVVLATSNKQEDSIMANYIKNLGFRVFCGNENNVLKRYKEANDLYNGDIVLRVTGDCPLIDSIIADNVITYFLSNLYDYVRLDVPDTFIRGFDIEIFSKQSLDKVYNLMLNESETSPYKEHVTLYMYKHPDEFNIGKVKGNDFYNKDYRLCVDTQEDFDLVKKIYKHFNNMYVSSKDIVEYLDENPHILKVNKDVSQKIVL